MSVLNVAINSHPTFDEAIRFASIRAIYVDRKPVTTIYIINSCPRVMSEMGNRTRHHRRWWLLVSPRRIIARVYVPVLLKRWTYRLIRRTDLTLIDTSWNFPMYESTFPMQFAWFSAHTRTISRAVLNLEAKMCQTFAELFANIPNDSNIACVSRNVKVRISKHIWLKYKRNF